MVRSELLGYRVEATEDEIIRRVGTLENGIVVEPDEEDNNSTSSTTLLVADYDGDVFADYESSDGKGLDDSSLYGGDGGVDTAHYEGGVAEMSLMLPLMFATILGILILGIFILTKVQKSKKNKKH